MIDCEEYQLPFIQNKLKNYTLCKNGDVIFADASEDTKDICKPVEFINTSKSKVVSGLHTIHARDIKNLTVIGFKGYLFSSYNFHKQVHRLTQGTKIFSINPGNFKEMFVGIPSAGEQRDIVSLLSKIDKRIATQNKIINKLESLICSLRSDIFSKYDWKWQKLDSFVNNGTITLKRGNVIPKHERNEEYKFPVYSSSIHNNGLMGFNNSYMFDKELITWSVDGGGNFFYRSKHKFNVTNVCGIMEAKDNIFNYRFLSEILSAQHSKMIFDYQTKAHPSVIEKLYKLPIVDIKIQEKIALIFELYYQKLEKEKDILSLYKKQKVYLLQNMFI